ncbi:MAG: ABC transporter ATP-binding protein [Candidatus Rifleibacteriota bacterium]
MNTVEVKDACKYFTSGETTVRAVDHVNFALNKAEFAVLAGPSGSGKTTLLNLIGGLDRADKGDVLIDNENLNSKNDEELTRERLEKIGFIFQSYNLIPVLSAYENVQFIMQIRGVPEEEQKKRILPLFEELGLESLEHRRPPELSGGQQQRVAVARAIVMEPAIVLADEPTANLDSESAVSLLEMMKRLNREKHVTFLFSSHDKKVIEIADRVISMRDGKIQKDEIK